MTTIIWVSIVGALSSANGILLELIVNQVWDAMLLSYAILLSHATVTH